jgi:CubicO group peptidase (beta-lactamase class C family)
MEPQLSPSEAGLDPNRLYRIAEYYDAFTAAGHIPGWQVTISRGGALAFEAHGGHADVEQGIPVEHDTVWRIYSMTKPITAVAAMILWEEGKFDLNDEVSKWIPSFAEQSVYVSGDPEHPVTEPLREPTRVWHLFTHMAGMTYGFTHMHPADAIYRLKGYEWGAPKGATLADAVDTWATSPLVFQPGDAWNYSVATDVIGRLVELWSGQSLDQFVKERITIPLKMYDTDFHLPDAKRERLAQIYVPTPTGGIAAFPDLGPVRNATPTMLSGGGGLVSTAHDYHRFTAMLLRGGELDGVRLLSGRTVALMTENYLPDGSDLVASARDSFSEVGLAGHGFGLAMAVVTNRAASRQPLAEGAFMWGGAASTTFWVDPVEDLTACFYTQLLPSSTYPIRRMLAPLVYQALVD